MSFEWNKFTQKLFWWKNTNIDPVIGEDYQNTDQNLKKVNLAIINTHKNLKKFYFIFSKFL